MGLCDEFQQAKCKNQFGDFTDAACKKCARRRSQDLDDYTLKMLRLRNLQAAGYPFGKNDLEPQEWEDLGKLNDIFR